jgi:DHA1 family bicyclomycin/chloramphenicol resistance-like MFS transporter
MEMYHVTEQEYGWIFSAIAAGLIGCSQFNNILLKKYNSAQILTVVLLIQAITGLVLVIGTASDFLNVYSTILLMFLFLSCQGFTFPNSAALAMAPFTKGAGSASAMMGATQMAFGAIASAMVGVFFNSTAIPLATIMFLCSLLGLLILLFGRKKIEYKASQADVEEQTLEFIEKY